MKRKATAASIRAGQTLYYVSERDVFIGGEPVVGRIRVESDRKPFAPVPGEVVEAIPRAVLRTVVGAPGLPQLTHSRREAEHLAKEYARQLARLRVHQEQLKQVLSSTIRRMAKAAQEAETV